MSNQVLVDILKTAAMQARLAQSLYGGRDGVELLANQVGARYRYIEHGNNTAAALIFQDHIHLSVCGSNDRLDWAQNATTDPMKHGDVVAHHGYVMAAEWLRKEIFRSDLMPIIEGTNWLGRLIIGGHSAGGAIAQLLSLEPRLRPREVFTFGSPKAFTAASAATYAAMPWETFRFVMDGDPVPFLPLKLPRLLLGRPQYAHTSSAMLLSPNGNLRAGNENALKKLLSIAMQAKTFGIAAIIAWLKRDAVFSDAHGIDGYLNAINASIRNV